MYPILNETSVCDSASRNCIDINLLAGRTASERYFHPTTKVQSTAVLNAYTRIETEKQQKEHLLGVLRSRTRKVCHLLRQLEPVNWHWTPWDLDGVQQWKEAVVQVRQRALRDHLRPTARQTARHPAGRMTMSCDIPINKESLVQS